MKYVNVVAATDSVGRTAVLRIQGLVVRLPVPSKPSTLELWLQLSLWMWMVVCLCVTYPSHPSSWFYTTSYIGAAQCKLKCNCHTVNCSITVFLPLIVVFLSYNTDTPSCQSRVSHPTHSFFSVTAHVWVCLFQCAHTHLRCASLMLCASLSALLGFVLFSTAPDLVSTLSLFLFLPLFSLFIYSLALALWICLPHFSSLPLHSIHSFSLSSFWFFFIILFDVSIASYLSLSLLFTRISLVWSCLDWESSLLGRHTQRRTSYHTWLIGVMSIKRGI